MEHRESVIVRQVYRALDITEHHTEKLYLLVICVYEVYHLAALVYRLYNNRRTRSDLKFN